RPTATFCRRAFREMYSFGYKLFFAGMLNILFNNIYVIVIAKVFSGPAVGMYFFANKLKDVVLMQLFSSVQAVTYPALAVIQDDRVRLKAAYRKMILVMSFTVFPAMLLLAALAEPLFQLMLPDRWLPAVPYLRLLCIAGLMYPV